MKKEELTIKNIIRSVLLVGGFTIFLFIVMVGSWKYFEKQTEEQISTPNAYFLLVVSENDKAKMIDFKDLEDYKKEHPNFTFLIPNEKIADFERQINEKLYDEGAEIDVKQISETSQILDIYVLRDGFEGSRYIATDKEFTPQMYKLASPGFVFLPCGTTFFIGFVGFFTLRFILWILKKRKGIK
jgi:hypothetical protein